MKTIFIDVETFYDQEYSLRRMTPVEYILDPRFELIGFSVADAVSEPRWIEGKHMAEFLRRLPNDVIMVSHNALFDMCVLSYRYGYIPKLMVDTMGMARAWLGHKLKRFSLEHVAAQLGIGVKGKTILKVVGMNALAIRQAGLWEEYGQYCCDDTELCRGIFRWIMMDGFPKEELKIMDMVLRTCVNPRFVLDQTVLHEHLNAVQQSKADLLARCGFVTKDDLMSNDRFAEALRVLGVEPPTKVSLTTGKETYAFAKTDAAFTDLEEHDDPDVQALVAARLGLKTTLEETRAQRFINISRLDWPTRGVTGLMPVPLRYGAAHTHRLGGDWKLNMQNLSRFNERIPGSGRLRRALIAPHGFKVLTVDASQVEARLNAWFCGEDGLVKIFADKGDVYSTFATEVFSRPINKKDNPVERFVAKQAILGLGYGMGAPRFEKQIVKDSRLQLGKPLPMTPEEALRIVGIYRRTYPSIVKMWRRLNDIIPAMTKPDCHIVLGPVTFKHQRIELPGGVRLNYHNLRYENDEWRYDYGPKWKRLYGAKLLENIIQTLSRQCTFPAGVRIAERFAMYDDPMLDLALQAHDELGYIVPDEMVEVCRAIVLEEMRARPVWAPDLPLDTEAGVGPSYGEAK